jgi:predicted LPLAT superfamily acyltransferase
LFDHALRAKQFKLLSAEEHPLRSVAIIAALRRGEIVALHGDRSLSEADLKVPFLGGEARFPIGPYFLAAASGAPLFQVFAVRERLGHYRLFSHPAEFVSRDVLRDRTGPVRTHVIQYAQRLAAVVRQYPFQWCNFYPFWIADSDPASAEESRPAPRKATHA